MIERICVCKLDKIFAVSSLQCPLVRKSLVIKLEISFRRKILYNFNKVAFNLYCFCFSSCLGKHIVRIPLAAALFRYFFPKPQDFLRSKQISMLLELMKQRKEREEYRRATAKFNESMSRVWRYVDEENRRNQEIEEKRAQERATSKERKALQR